MKISTSSLLAGIILLTCLNACKKFVEIPLSPQIISTSAIFTNDNTAISAVDGVYTSMRAASPSFENGAFSIYTGLSGDEIINNSANTNYDPFRTNTILSTSSIITTTFWSTPYNTIYRANAILAGLSNATKLSDSVKKQLTGEMDVVRALTYFYLVNLYGDVPLITTPSYTISSGTGRTPSPQVYQQIIADLTTAQKLLTNNYPSTGKARPNLQTATALLARVYLYQQDWKDALVQSNLVISSGVYSLVPDLNSVFLIGSNETIWEIASPNETKSTAEGANFIPPSPSVKPVFSINPYLLQAFEPGDLRLQDWIKTVTINGTSYNYPYKYKSRSTTAITEYEVVFRLAEQYLIKAEAEAQLNDISDAVNDLDIIRIRAGLQPLPAGLSQAQCLAATVQERRVELFNEWGHRWFDLKRTSAINAVLSTEKSSWQGFDALYPLPYQQILYNPLLIQNPGYN